MSIPASVILGGDLDTVGRLRSGRLDYPWFPTMTRPYAEGQMLEVEASVTDFTIQYEVPHDFELYSIALACSEYAMEDSWSVYMGDDEPANYILKDIYTKDLPEGFQLMAVITLFKGDILTLKFNNRSGREKKVWINYQGLVNGVGQSDPQYRPVEPSEEGLHLSDNLFGGNKGLQLENGLYSEATPFHIEEGSTENFMYGEGRAAKFRDLLPSNMTIDSMVISDGYRADFYESPSVTGSVVLSVIPGYIYYVLVNDTSSETLEEEKKTIVDDYFSNVAASPEFRDRYTEDKLVFLTKSLLDKAKSFKITKI